MKTKFNGDSTNINRARAGSERGLAGRKYPILLAEKLNTDASFCSNICKQIGKNPDMFVKAIAGNAIPSRIPGLTGEEVTTKTNLVIKWNDGSYTNFRVKISSPGQIHLGLAEKFISGFEAQFKTAIPAKVKNALLLFIGRHPNQKKILDSVDVEFVGTKIRESVERKYNNRLTLASMYGYDDQMPVELLKWFRENAANLFLFCFSIGEAKNRSFAPEYLLFHDTDEVDSAYRIYHINSLFNKINSISKNMPPDWVDTGDKEKIGSTINLPFGNLQYHLWELQFRHIEKSIARIVDFVAPEKKKTFGSKQKKSGHENEKMIAEALNHNKKFREHFCERIGRNESEFDCASADGANAPQEESVIGGKTPGKTDVVVKWKNGTATNISIKKNAGGQVYLVTVKNFVEAYEKQYGKSVPQNVKRALELFIGEASDSKAILDEHIDKIVPPIDKKLAYEQNYRLFFDVLLKYNKAMAEELLQWLKDNIASIFELCFSAGAVKNPTKWARIIWYKNLVDTEGQGLDYMISIECIKHALEMNGINNTVVKGPKNAGTTLWLPFGHLQYLGKKLEFYQELKKIQKLLCHLPQESRESRNDDNKIP